MTFCNIGKGLIVLSLLSMGVYGLEKKEEEEDF